VTDIKVAKNGHKCRNFFSFADIKVAKNGHKCRNFFSFADTKIVETDTNVAKSLIPPLIKASLRTATYIKLQVINRNKEATYKYLHFYIQLQ